MGSFNVSCCVSHLTIAPGDPAVLLPLRKSDYFFKDFGTVFDAPFVMYPPIKGVYDDYGRLRDIEPPVYHTHWSLGAKFIQGATSSFDEVIEGYTYTWLRRSVWDHMIKKASHLDKIVSDKFYAYIKERQSYLDLNAKGLILPDTAIHGLRMIEQNLRMIGVLEPVSDHLEPVKPEIIELAKFIHNCFMCKVMITPVAPGPQFGELENSLALATLIRDIAQTDLDTYEALVAEDDDPEYDDDLDQDDFGEDYGDFGDYDEDEDEDEDYDDED